MKSINEILFSEDQDELRAALREAKDLAKSGRVIELLDFLCPEDAAAKSLNKRGKGRIPK